MQVAVAGAKTASKLLTKWLLQFARVHDRVVQRNGTRGWCAYSLPSRRSTACSAISCRKRCHRPLAELFGKTPGAGSPPQSPDHQPRPRLSGSGACRYTCHVTGDQLAGVPILAIEERCLNAWPAAHTIVHDGWLLRLSDNYTRRANSVQPLYPTTCDLAAAIAYCEKVYAARGQDTIFKMTPAAQPAALDATLAALGYAEEAPTSVQSERAKRFRLFGGASGGGPRLPLRSPWVKET